MQKRGFVGAVNWTGLWAVALSLAAAQGAAAEQAPKVVYGEDDRMDVYAHPDPFWQDLATAGVVAFVDAADVREGDDGRVRLVGRPLSQSVGVCTDEPFHTQPTAAFCSGALIAPDLVLTAGHCVAGPAGCERLRMVFGYYKDAPGQLATITTADVHRCAEVMAWREEYAGLDFAILRLDRPASGTRQPVTLRRQDALLPPGTPVGMIGFPSGLPMKIAIGGLVVRNDSAARYFEATVDAFAGNSGSGVFTRDGELVGLLARGAPDYINDGGCLRSNVLPETGPGQLEAEGVVYAARAIESLCARHTHAVCDAVELSPQFDATASEPDWTASPGGWGDDDDSLLCSAAPAGTVPWWLLAPALLLIVRRRP